MKILALGNSFSEDCTAYLQPLTGLYVRNLYIGGCSLETHARNLDGNAAAYVLEADGTAADDRRHAAAEVIAGTDWDVVTVQQCSGLSGIYESYFPYLDTVLAHIRRLTRADIVFNETWAYAPDSTHEAFADYKRDTVYMFGRISVGQPAAPQNAPDCRFCAPARPSSRRATTAASARCAATDSISTGYGGSRPPSRGRTFSVLPAARSCPTAPTRKKSRRCPP